MNGHVHKSSISLRNGVQGLEHVIQFRNRPLVVYACRSSTPRQLLVDRRRLARKQRHSASYSTSKGTKQAYRTAPVRAGLFPDSQEAEECERREGEEEERDGDAGADEARGDGAHGAVHRGRRGVAHERGVVARAAAAVLRVRADRAPLRRRVNRGELERRERERTCRSDAESVPGCGRETHREFGLEDGERGIAVLPKDVERVERVGRAVLEVETDEGLAGGGLADLERHRRGVLDCVKQGAVSLRGLLGSGR